MKQRKRPCTSCEKLRKQIGVLQENVDRLRDMVSKLADENAALKAENQALREKVSHLEERLNTNSSNSSKPPSSDPPDKKPRSSRPKNKSKRKRGAQPGHPDQQRKLYPEDQVDKIVACIPEACEQCDRKLTDGIDPSPRRTQTAEIPPPKPMITEFQQHARQCGDCGHTTVGRLPADADTRAFGPRVQAVVSLLSGAFRLSKREVKRIMADVFCVEMSLGTVCNLQHATSQALEAPVEEAKAFVKSQPAVHLDETGWREAKSRSWLWTAVTTTVIVFLIRFSRGAKVARELIGPHYRGIAHSDRWGAYSWIAPRKRQICWSPSRPARVRA